MIYALVITIAAALLIFAAIGGGALLLRRAVAGDGYRSSSIGSLRWQPTPVGLLLFLPMVVLLLLRILPGMALLSFLLRSGRAAGPLFFLWNLGGRSRWREHRDDDDAIPGEFRPLDDE